MSGNSEESLAVKQQFAAWLEKKKWTYKEEEDEAAYIYRFELRGEDLPIDVIVVFEKERPQLAVLSRLPVTIPDEKKAEACILLNQINDASDFGKITMNPGSGKLRFRYCAFFGQCLVSDDFFAQVIFNSVNYLDDFNDRLLMYSKGMVPAETAMKGLLFQ